MRILQDINIKGPKAEVSGLLMNLFKPITNAKNALPYLGTPDFKNKYVDYKYLRDGSDFEGAYLSK